MTSVDAIAAGLLPYLPLLARMAAVALFVVSIAVIAERLGPFLGGMVASLPLYTGPIYVLLGLEHDAHYLAAAAVASVAICGANPVFIMTYALMAERCGALASVAAALGAWGVCAVAVKIGSFSLVPALLFAAPVYVVALAFARHFTRGVALRAAPRRWSDLALRAVLVAGLSGAIIVLSGHVPPQVTGILSVMPILMSSLILVLHPRVGGRATAALLVHTLGGLVGMVVAFALVSVVIERAGTWPGLSMGLGVTLAWNAGLVAVRGLRQRRARRDEEPSPAPSPLASAPPMPDPPAIPPGRQRASSASMRSFM